MEIIPKYYGNILNTHGKQTGSSIQSHKLQTKKCKIYKIPKNITKVYHSYFIAFLLMNIFWVFVQFMLLLFFCVD